MQPAFLLSHFHETQPGAQQKGQAAHPRSHSRARMGRAAVLPSPPRSPLGILSPPVQDQDGGLPGELLEEILAGSLLQPLGTVGHQLPGHFRDEVRTLGTGQGQVKVCAGEGCGSRVSPLRAAGCKTEQPGPEPCPIPWAPCLHSWLARPGVVPRHLLASLGQASMRHHCPSTLHPFACSPCGSESSASTSAHMPSASHPGSLHTQPVGEGEAESWPLGPVTGVAHLPPALSTPGWGPSTYHPIQEGDAAGQLGPCCTELAEQQAPDGLPLAQAVVVSLCGVEGAQLGTQAWSP